MTDNKLLVSEAAKDWFKNPEFVAPMMHWKKNLPLPRR